MIHSHFGFARSGKEAQFLKSILYDEEKERSEEIEEYENEE